MHGARRWRIVALLAVGIAIGVVMTATPATGHVAGWAHNWTKHIRPEADKRYIQPTELRPGMTLRGVFAFADDDDFGVGSDSISFPVRLPSVPLVRIIGVGATPPAECPGSVGFPKAKPGYLCVYVSWTNGAGTVNTIDPENVGSQPSAGRYGAWIYANASGTSRLEVTGTWAVTARATTPGARPIHRPFSGSATED